MTFTEMDHPRSVAGTFTNKPQSAAEVTLDFAGSDDRDAWAEHMERSLHDRADAFVTETRFRMAHAVAAKFPEAVNAWFIYNGEQPELLYLTDYEDRLLWGRAGGTAYGADDSGAPDVQVALEIQAALYEFTAQTAVSHGLAEQVGERLHAKISGVAA